MDTSKKILAAIFAFLFILTAVLALILFNFDRKGFSAGTYQKAFAKADFYNQIPIILSETMVSSITKQEELPLVMQSMNAKAWEDFFRALLPQDALKAMGDEALNSVFDYLNLHSNSAELSLTSLKTSMTDGTGAQAAITLLKTMPDCTLDQVAQITKDIFAGNGIQFCNPPEKLIPALTPVIQAQMEITALTMPEHVTLIKAPVENDPRPRLENARMIMRLSPIVPLGFLMLVTLFAVSSLISWLKWWGVPFIITGGLAVLMSLSGAKLTSFILQRSLVNGAPNILPAVMQGYASDLASAMVKALLTPVLWQGLFLAVIGFVMVAGAVMVRGKK